MHHFNYTEIKVCVACMVYQCLKLSGKPINNGTFVSDSGLYPIPVCIRNRCAFGSGLTHI